MFRLCFKLIFFFVGMSKSRVNFFLYKQTWAWSVANVGGAWYLVSTHVTLPAAASKLDFFVQYPIYDPQVIVEATGPELIADCAGFCVVRLSFSPLAFRLRHWILWTVQAFIVVPMFLFIVLLKLFSTALYFCSCCIFLSTSWCCLCDHAPTPTFSYFFFSSAWRRFLLIPDQKYSSHQVLPVGAAGVFWKNKDDQLSQVFVMNWN